jgi:hypothetical protein
MSGKAHASAALPPDKETQSRSARCKDKILNLGHLARSPLLYRLSHPSPDLAAVSISEKRDRGAVAGVYLWRMSSGRDVSRGLFPAPLGCFVLVNVSVDSRAECTAIPSA